MQFPSVCIFGTNFHFLINFFINILLLIRQAPLRMNVQSLELHFLILLVASKWSSGAYLWSTQCSPDLQEDALIRRLVLWAKQTELGKVNYGLIGTNISQPSDILVFPQELLWISFGVWVLRRPIVRIPSISVPVLGHLEQMVVRWLIRIDLMVYLKVRAQSFELLHAHLVSADCQKVHREMWSNGVEVVDTDYLKYR